MAAESPMPGPAEGVEAALGSARAAELSSERTAAQTDERQLRILVVEKGSDRPIAGARVLLQKEPTDELEWKEAWERWGDVESILANGFGEQQVSDERGSLLVPRPGRNLWVTADLGELHGEARIDRKQDVCKIEVKPYHSLAIEVVDELGKPAQGVRVALMEGIHGEWWAPWSGITGSDGRVELVKLEDQPDEAKSTLALGPCFSMATPAQVEFTLDDVPASPLRFALEPTGSIEVLLCNAQGRVLDLDATIQLKLMGSELSAAASRVGSHDAPARAGRAVFERIGLGLELEASARIKGQRFGNREFAGPATAGEQIRVGLPFQESCTLVRGRALDEHGEPLQGKQVSGELVNFAGTPHPGRFSASTDETGRFTGEFVPMLKVFGPLSLRLSLAGPGLACRTAVAEVDLAANSPRLELGDVVFLPLEVFVRGMVLDESGAPVYYARIEAKDAVTRRDLSHSSGEWSVYSDSLGRFAIAGTSRPAEIELTAFSYGHLRPPPIRVPAGSDNVLITFPRCGRLEGRARLPEGFEWGALDFDFEYVGESRVTPTWENYADGYFLMPAATPGTLAVRLSHADVLLWERDDVEIRLGETTQLGEIDLRDRLFVMTLDIVDASGQPVRRGTLGWSAGEDEDSFEQLAIPSSGPVRFLSARNPVNVRIRASGFRSERFDGVRSGDRLVLRDGIAVQVSLPPRLPVVDPPLSLRLYWNAAGEGEYAGIPVGSDGRAQLRLPGPGSFELSWVIRHELTGAEFFAEDAAPTPVQVPESCEVQPMLLEISSQSLLRALERARGAN